MARFKFAGKNKHRSDADLTNISVISQGDYTSHHLKTPASTTGNQSPELPHLGFSDYTEPSYMGESHDTDSRANHRRVDSGPGTALKPAAFNVRPGEEITPWTRHKLFDSPFPRYRHAASAIPSDKGEIFMMGGLKEGSVFGDTWKIVPHFSGGRLDFSTENLEISSGINPPARVGHSAVLCGNAFIIYGGDTVETDNNGFPDNNFYLFNINNKKYTVPTHILNKPHGRYGHTLGVIALNNQLLRLYLFGGQLENDVFNDLYYFELNTFKSPKARWETVEPLNNFKPPPLTNHSMTVHKNRIYIFGGVYNNEKVLNDLWCFDAIINKWTQIATTGSVPSPVNEHSACIVSDKLYIYGGNDFQGTIYDTLYVLDLHLLVWLKLIDAGQLNGPGARCGHLMTYLPQFKKLIIMGGDKNDFVGSDPTNYETYEEYPDNASSGTMIYDLDLNSLDNFLLNAPVKKPVIGGRKKREKEVEDEVNGAVPIAAAATAAPIYNKGNEGNGYESLEPARKDFSHTPVGYPSRDIKDINGNPDITASATDLVSFEHSSISETKNLDPYKYEDHNKLASVVPSSSIPDNRFPAPTLEETNNRNISTNGHAYLENISRSTPVPDSAADQQQSQEVKKLVGELTTELNNLKASTAEQIELAHLQIEELRSENHILKLKNQDYAHFDAREIELQKKISDRDDLITGLKGDLSGEASNRSISDVNKYKLDSLELSNKIVYLEKENSQLNKKMKEFEPFMDNQITELLNFQKIIKVQEEKILLLQKQVIDQETLEKEVSDWKHKYESLEIEHSNFKAIHENEDIEVSDEEPEIGGDNGENRSLHSTVTKRSKRDISQHLESLVAAWNNKSVVASPSTNDKEIEVESGAADHEDLIAKLQKQVDDLLVVSKEQQSGASTEIEALRLELSEKIDLLKTFETNYKDALLSVNNTSKALDRTQEELEKQRELSRRLQKENQEFKLLQKANKRISRLSTPTLSENAANSPVIRSNVEQHEGDDDEGEDLKNAHFNLKLQDLQADLFILKQERDQLKDDVTSLKKQLYISQQKLN